ncbi:GNAT family N-acetyltransferase [Brevibacillus parabrevis]|uniref:GNAT family N-acetyltransferase n=1 Tax=Brevibacillus parabrevis TaxID=54914 RepID=UPI0039F1A8AB
MEIGSTWLTPAMWRTSINTEAKYLLLAYCFETAGAIRVQLKTDSRNVRSQRAIERSCWRPAIGQAQRNKGAKSFPGAAWGDSFFAARRTCGQIIRKSAYQAGKR